MTVALVDEDGKSFSSGAGGASPGIFNQTGTLVTARLLPNKDYTVTVGGSISPFLSSSCQYKGSINFASETRGIYVDGTATNMKLIAGSGSFRSGNGAYNFKVRVSLPTSSLSADVPTNLRGGDCTSLLDDKPVWYVGLGNLRNGNSAGAVGFRYPNFGSASFFTPSALYYTSPDITEVSVVNTPAGSSNLRQIYSREVLVDIITLTSSRYKLDIYTRSQVTGQSGGIYTTSGSPIITYVIQEVAVSNGDGVKITRTEDGQTWETALELSDSTWTRRDWKLQGSSLSAYTTTVYATPNSATVSHTGPTANLSGSETPHTWTKTYTDHSSTDANWGRELTETRHGSASETVPLVQANAYYTTTGSDGSFKRQLKHSIDASGSWVKYLYYDTTIETGPAGAIKRVYRPWGDGPTSPDEATPANSVYTDYQYDVKNPEYTTSTITCAPGGTVLSKSTWTYVYNYTLNGMPVMQATCTEYSGDTAAVTTISRSYQYDTIAVSFRNQQVSVMNADGRKDSWVYFNGTWNSATKMFSASAGGSDRLVYVFHGQTAGGTAVTSWTKDGVTQAVHSVQMVGSRSTVTEQVIDSSGHLVFTGENVYTTGGELARIAGVLYRFDDHNRLRDTVDIMRSSAGNELKSQRAYIASLLDTETAMDGVVTKQEYDGLLRAYRKTAGYGGPSPYPATVVTTQYDGDNRVEAAYAGTDSNTATLYSYDSAGRLEWTSEPSPNGGTGLNTSYDYSAGPRKMTCTLPNGGTRTTELYLDGRTKSIAGTAQAPSSFSYSYNSTGLLTTRQNGSTKENGWMEEQADRLGRVVCRSTPTWGWAIGSSNILDYEFEYNNLGQRWRERVKYRATSTYLTASRIHTYDAAGRPFWDGSDINNDGALTEASNDRIAVNDQWYAQDSSGWLTVSQIQTYATLNSGTATQIASTSNRLTGFGASSYGLTTGDSITTDTTGRTLHQFNHVDSSQKKRRTETQYTGASNTSYAESINGYASESQSASGARGRNEYDSLGRLQHARGRWNGSAYVEVTSYVYYGNTPYVNTVTANGIPVSYSYAWNPTAGTRQVSVTDASNYVSNTLFNTKNLAWRTWGSGTTPTESIYDDLGRRLTLTAWRSGSFDETGTGDTTTWVPEPATGLLKQKTFADTHHVDFEYTPLGQVAKRTNARNIVTNYYYFDGSTTSSGDVSHRTQELRQITYPTDGTPSVSYTYARTGAVAKVSDFTGSRSFAYRSDLQLDTETLDPVFYGAGRTLKAGYEDGTGGTVAGRSNGYAFQTSGGNETSAGFTFNAATGRIETATGQNLSSFSYAYTPGTDWAESVTSGSFARTQQLHSSRSVLKQTQATWNAVAVASYDSGFTDARGYRSSQSASGTLPGSSRTDDFLYDGRGQVSSSTDLATSARTFNWGYDLLGNRLNQVNVRGNLSYTPDSLNQYSEITNDIYTPDNLNQYSAITGESGLTYDADGNLTIDGTWTNSFDAENRLWTMVRKDGTQSLQFAYDYLGRRVRKIVRSGGLSATVTSSTKFVWNGWKLLAELDEGTSLTGTTLSKSYLWGTDFSGGTGAGGLLAVRQGGANYLPVYDPQGNVTGYLDSLSGSVAASYDYNAYGDIQQQAGSATSFAFGHATQYTDRETGMIYYGMRYYQPKHGRFVNRDPIEEAGGINLHAFVGNNPVNGWDLRGMEERWGEPGEADKINHQLYAVWASSYMFQERSSYGQPCNQSQGFQAPMDWNQRFIDNEVVNATARAAKENSSSGGQSNTSYRASKVDRNRIFTVGGVTYTSHRDSNGDYITDGVYDPCSVIYNPNARGDASRSVDQVFRDGLVFEMQGRNESGVKTTHGGTKADDKAKKLGDAGKRGRANQDGELTPPTTQPLPPEPAPEPLGGMFPGNPGGKPLIPEGGIGPITPPKDWLPPGWARPPIGGNQGYPWGTWSGSSSFNISPTTARNVTIGAGAGVAVGAAWYFWLLPALAL